MLIRFHLHSSSPRSTLLICPVLEDAFDLLIGPCPKLASPRHG